MRCRMLLLIPSPWRKWRSLMSSMLTKNGKPLDDIPLLRALPAFWNSANRALKTYLDVLPDDSEVLDLAEHISQAIGGGEDDSNS